jgi:hypothetical protein
LIGAAYSINGAFSDLTRALLAGKPRPYISRNTWDLMNTLAWRPTAFGLRE